MNCSRRDFLALMSAAGMLGLSACAKPADPAPETQAATTASTVDLTEFESLAIDSSKWTYDKVNDVWWQTGLVYCTDPATKTYESLGVYVPGAYLSYEEEGATSGKVKINSDATVGTYTARTAPVVMPINAAGYSAQPAPSTFSYEGLAPYLEAGLIYVYCGFRGRSGGYDSTISSGDGFYEGGSPWSLIDLKAAVRYLRYNAESIPGDLGAIYPFGHAAGGALACLLGCTGAFEGFDSYLRKIGAATHDAQGNKVNDVVAGVCCWCPDTSLGIADAAYEWELGQYASGGTREGGTWTKMLSNDLAGAYADYVNTIGLRADDEDLVLDPTEGGIATDGTYYTAVLNVVEDSLASFLANTEFPYTPSVFNITSGVFPGDGTMIDDAVAQAAAQEQASSPDTAGQEVVTYADIDEYVAAINGDARWVTYNRTRQTARITSLEDFVQHCRPATREVSSFDSITKGAAGNQLFGIDDKNMHFSQTTSDLLARNQGAYATLTGWDATLPNAWAADLVALNDDGVSVSQRRDLLDPLYYLSGAFGGFGRAEVAPRWRINVGMADTTTAPTAALNLSLALRGYEGVSNVDFTGVWDKGCELAERSGDAASNFIGWLAYWQSK